ncbi:MAG: arsenic transporter [Peptococcaceae bacterium]|nr:arsenic transporter [Peptococcaceae bacterium]
MMFESAMIPITILAFVITIILILWRPNGLNEAMPATFGALLVLLSGSVSIEDLGIITSTISGAAITIMATIVMANVLESFGFFNWAAEGLAARAKGSGIRLFWLVNLLCFLMTMFFNNDGSILITTPILLILLEHFKLKNSEKIAYLLSGALIATASSAPIGVSNIVNLIALKIVGMTLYMHTLMMFVPATIGLVLLLLLLYFRFYKRLPRVLPSTKFQFYTNLVKANHPPAPPEKHLTHPPHPSGPRPHHYPPHSLEHYPHEHPVRNPYHHPVHDSNHYPMTSQEILKINYENRNKFMRNVLLFVLFVRMSLFIASYLSIPIAFVAVTGSLLLLTWRWIYATIPPTDLIQKIPWHIFVFAFSMYVIIYGLNNIGLTNLLVNQFEQLVKSNLYNASLVMGTLISMMSIFFNNHPALLIGTLTLTNMNLDPLTMKIAYLASVIGSDVGSLLLPIGTLASLIWMYILRQNGVKIRWKDYVTVTIVAIPPTVLFTLLLLASWVDWIFTSLH